MAQFQVKKAVREKIHPKIALIAPSGGGKTYSALRLATGMGDWIRENLNREPKILMANTEAKRGYYYCDEFSYDIVDIEAPHNPEKYVDLIEFAVEQGYDLLILDSATHEWEGKGGCLELQQQAGGTYQAWARVTPRHNKYINAIASSPIAIIATMRGKDQYEISKDEKGKTTVQKIAAGASQRNGFEYEFTCTFMIDQKTNCAEVQKDNTHIFEHEGPMLLTENHGKKIMEWANDGATPEEKPVFKPSAANQNLEKLHTDIISICSKLGGTKNENLMNKLKEYTPNGNPKLITDPEMANKLLDELNQME